MSDPDATPVCPAAHGLSAPITPAERREFVPFMHRLIGAAFAAIKPLFLRGVTVRAKADTTPVTAADRGAEAAMRREIERAYPAHGIVGEEYGEKPGRGYRWILDPVDGTRAFITHCFLFGTLIALERDDGTGFAPILGAIAHPAAGVALIGDRDRTRLYAADGTERSARVRPCARLEEATVLATTHWETGEQRGGEGSAALIRRARLYRTWGDCFGYFALATGAADVMLDPTLAYWDVAALVPVVEGAGGRLTSWSGGNPLSELSLIATAGPLHEEVLRVLRQQAVHRPPG
ncbi:MAG: inositol monophosphatase [Burkholderiaceae bacterium]|jgi:myo-inositol-1(or 4)-monophosphatase|nr:inositol monophosphatase [Burkholderiaceae bacterium]